MTTPYFNNLIGAKTLHLLPANDVLIIDARHSLTDFDFGKNSYLEAHIPNAHFLNMETDLSGEKTGQNGRHPLPDFEVFANKLRALGLRDGMQVVAYDDAAGVMAARVWWLLRALGFEHVAVLDGGIDAWTRAGFSLSAEPSSTKVTTAVGTFTRKTSLNRTVTANEILAQLPIAKFTLVDARAPERYRGEIEPLDPVSGHIPTAVNQFMINNIDEHGYFKPAEILRAQWLELLDDTPMDTVVHYCGSGVTACHNLLSMHIAGLDVSTTTGAGIYAGSWSEWCADARRPVAKKS